MDDADYEVVVVGGGPAGLSAALYATRLGHETLLVDRGGGRAAMMLDTHNVIGVPESVSGNEFLATAWDQLESYGTDLRRGFVDGIDRRGDGFTVSVDDDVLAVERVVLATGFNDGSPDPPLPRTGRGLHYCLHCDAYDFVDEPVYAMGTGDAAAQVAMIMLNFTDDVDLLLRGAEPTWSEESDRQLRAHPVAVIDEEVESVENGPDGWLEAFVFEDGVRREYRGGFAMYGADYNDELARELGCELNDDGTVAVDDRGRTSVEGVYAVGDLTPGHNQIPVAMGEGANAGIAIHKELRTYPVPVDELDDGSVVPSNDSEAVPDRAHSGDD